MFVRLNELWRVGYHDDPLSVCLEYQGNGRFDDPLRECTVLYGSDMVETCIIESAMPWSLHPDASYVQRTEAPERDVDSELQQAELDDADRDRLVAMRPAHMPANLYDKAKVYVALAEPIVVLDLDDIGVRRDLAQIPEIAARMREHGLLDLDRSILMGRYLDLTRTISGYLMRQPFARHRFAGIRALSRHAGNSYMLFEGRYRLGTRMVGPINLTPEDPRRQQERRTSPARAVVCGVAQVATRRRESAGLTVATKQINLASSLIKQRCRFQKTTLFGIIRRTSVASGCACLKYLFREKALRLTVAPTLSLSRNSQG